MNLLARLSLIFLTLVTACSQDHETSQLHQKAIPNDSTVSVHKIKDGPVEFYLYVSKGKGYRIDCGSDEAGTQRLIASLGISPAILANSRSYRIDSQEYTDWTLTKQPRLTCQPEGKFLYRMELQGEEKYFLADPEVSATRLYNIGCSGLIEAMGFSLNKSYLIPSYLLTDTKVFSADDGDDLNCLTGVSPSSKFTWTQGKSEELNILVGTDLPLRVFEATRADGSFANLVASTVGVCDWLKITPVAHTLLISGRAPKELQNKECSVAISEKDSLESNQAVHLKVTANQVNWQLNGSSDVNGNNICDGLEDCVYMQSSASLLWAKRLDQGLKNWTAAAAYCDKLDYSGFSDWRLPTKDEALKAAQDEVWSDLKAVLLNNAPSTWTSTETTDGKPWIINLSNGNGATYPKTYVTANSVICVRK